MNERAHKKQAYMAELSKVFKAIDVDESGQITLDELEAMLKDPQLKSVFQYLELEVHDAEALFRLLDEGDGEVTFQEFIKGVMRLKGQARSIDLIALMRTGDRMLDMCKALQWQVDEVKQLQLKSGWQNNETSGGI